jgi:hypothetical protein
MVSNIQGFGQMPPMGGMRPPKALSDDQKQKVTDILSKYDSSSLTETDAKSIFKAFEEAGIKGAGLKEAIDNAGFNADKLWSLAHDGQEAPKGPPPGGSGGGPSSTGKVNSSALKTLQDILNQYDLSNLSSEDEKSLFSQLTQTGLIRSGSLLDTQA